jgi:competence protein ComGC
MGTNMMIFLVITGIFVLVGLPIIAVIEARRMDKGKDSIISKNITTQKKKDEGESKSSIDKST